jgi:hypothetical protein
VIQGTLRAYYFQLRLSIEDYEFPHFNTGRDGNALACQAVVEDTEIGDSYLRHRPTLYNYELASFTEQLRALEREGSGQAVLGDADPESGDELGLRRPRHTRRLPRQPGRRPPGLRADQHRPVLPRRCARALQRHHRHLPRSRRHHRRLSHTTNRQSIH